MGGRVKSLCTGIAVIVASLLSPAPLRAQISTLACSGVARTYDLHLPRAPTHEFVIDVDFQRRTVRGFPRFYELPITQIAYSFVSFARTYKLGPDNVVREAGGTLNQDGSLVFYIRTIPRPSQLAGLYQMKCRPLNRPFA